MGKINAIEIFKRDPFFTTSNMLSVSRIPLSAGISWVHYSNGGTMTPILWGMIFIGIISDFLDGFFARRNNQITELGKVLDPVSDKIGAFIFFSYTVFVLQWIPYWYLGLIFYRDGIILTGSFYIKAKVGDVAMSIMSGKITVNALAAYWISVIVSDGVYYWPQTALLWISVACMMYSYFDYAFRFFSIVQHNRTDVV
jgi:phosphatidylglycerophosphate synthase